MEKFWIKLLPLDEQSAVLEERKAHHKERKRQWYLKNQQISRERAREWAKNNKDRHRELTRRWARNNRPLRHDSVKCWKYNITVAEYNELKQRANGVCEICGKTPRGLKARQLHIDHNHKTGQVRGLLCSRCNNAIGWIETFKDNLEWAKNLKTYLHQFDASYAD